MQYNHCYPSMSIIDVMLFININGWLLIVGICSIEDGQVKAVEGELSKSMLENNKCYILDRGSELFIWVGRVTQVEERKAASQAAEVGA